MTLEWVRGAEWGLLVGFEGVNPPFSRLAVTVSDPWQASPQQNNQMGGKIKTVPEK